MFCERDPDPNARIISKCESHTCNHGEQNVTSSWVYILYTYGVPFVPNDLHAAAHLNDALVI